MTHKNSIGKNVRVSQNRGETFGGCPTPFEPCPACVVHEVGIFNRVRREMRDYAADCHLSACWWPAGKQRHNQDI